MKIRDKDGSIIRLCDDLIRDDGKFFKVKMVDKVMKFISNDRCDKTIYTMEDLFTFSYVFDDELTLSNVRRRKSLNDDMRYLEKYGLISKEVFDDIFMNVMADKLNQILFEDLNEVNNFYNFDEERDVEGRVILDGVTLSDNELSTLIINLYKDKQMNVERPFKYAILEYGSEILKNNKVYVFVEKKELFLTIGLGVGYGYNHNFEDSTNYFRAYEVEDVLTFKDILELEKTRHVGNNPDLEDVEDNDDNLKLYVSREKMQDYVLEKIIEFVGE